MEPCSSSLECHLHESCIKAPLKLLDPTCVSNAVLSSLGHFSYEGERRNTPEPPTVVSGPPTPSPTTGSGATYSVCKPGGYCQNGACRDNGHDCNDTSTICRCEPDGGFKHCIKEADCSPDESCILADGLVFYTCVGDIVIPSLTNVEYAEKADKGERVTRVGASFDQCFELDDCIEPRECKTVNVHDAPEGVTQEEACRNRLHLCRCFRPVEMLAVCDVDANCPQYEYCHISAGGAGLCVSVYCEVSDRFDVTCEGDEPLTTQPPAPS